MAINKRTNIETYLESIEPALRSLEYTVYNGFGDIDPEEGETEKEFKKRLEEYKSALRWERWYHTSLREEKKALYRAFERAKVMSFTRYMEFGNSRWRAPKDGAGLYSFEKYSDMKYLKKLEDEYHLTPERLEGCTKESYPSGTVYKHPKWGLCYFEYNGGKEGIL